MKKTAIISTLGALLVGAMPIVAQQYAAATLMAPTEEHAQLGLLEAIGVGNNRVVIALPGEPGAGVQDRTYQSYDTNEQTLVEGLGSIMEVSSSLAPYEGDVVLVTYVNQGEHFLAKRIDFTEDRSIQQSRGTIERIDWRGRQIVLRNDKGTEETLHLGSGPGAVIDSTPGLRKFSDLRLGQHVIAYFGPERTARMIWVG